MRNFYIAGELHDSVVGQLAAIKMNFNAIQHQYNLEHIPEYEETMQQLSDASDDVRKTAHNLMPAVLLQGGLIAAVQHFCKKMSRHHEIDFQHYCDMPRLDPDFELSAYRIIQELVQNVIKHAQASRVLVQLTCTANTLSITVEDDGIGIVSTDLQEKGMGIKNIATRVKAYNGQMDVDSPQTGGTTIYIEFEIGILKTDPLIA